MLSDGGLAADWRRTSGNRSRKTTVTLRWLASLGGRTTAIDGRAAPIGGRAAPLGGRAAPIRGQATAIGGHAALVYDAYKRDGFS